MATIATHNGSKVHQSHNRREQRCVVKEEHIQADGWHENWIDVPIKKAYHDLFDDAVNEYNETQKRAERKINDYYKKIENDVKKHTAYEMIVGVYGDQPKEISYAILQDFVGTWNKRNPNLILIGAYFHADEQGTQPHIHLDYIPISDNYSRGMSLQTGLNKALGDQGFQKHGRDTAQILWERRENQKLENICKQYGLDIEHPHGGKKVEHLEKKEYIATQKSVEAEKHLDNLEWSISNAKEQKMEALRDRDQARIDKDYFKALKKATDAVEKYDEEIIEVLERTEPREKGLFSQSKPATVTIKAEDFEALKELQEAYNDALEMMYQFKALEQSYRKSAADIHKNRIDGYRESYEKDLAVLTKELDEKTETINRARSTIQNLREKMVDMNEELANLKEEHEELVSLINENPEQWNEFIRAVEVEQLQHDYDQDYEIEL